MGSILEQLGGAQTGAKGGERSGGGGEKRQQKRAKSKHARKTKPYTKHKQHKKRTGPNPNLYTAKQKTKKSPSKGFEFEEDSDRSWGLSGERGWTQAGLPAYLRELGRKWEGAGNVQRAGLLAEFGEKNRLARIPAPGVPVPLRQRP